MGKAEWGIIAFFLLSAWPVSFLAVAACGAFVLSNVTRIPGKAFPMIGLAALGLGGALAVMRLKSLVRGFYAWRTVSAALVYLLWSAIASALFMGLPIGNLGLGVLAGLYVGRREHHTGAGRDRFAREARTAGLFTAAITGSISLAVGILAVQERTSLERFLALVGLGQLAETPAHRAVIIALAVPVLFVAQYWLTRQGARWGFGAAGCSD